MDGNGAGRTPGYGEVWDGETSTASPMDGRYSRTMRRKDKRSDGQPSWIKLRRPPPPTQILRCGIRGRIDPANGEERSPRPSGSAFRIERTRPISFC